MNTSENTKSRPRAYVHDAYFWNIRRVPKTIKLNGRTIPHPGKKCALFIVHGMGDQGLVDTSVPLRSGFEDALDAIRLWQSTHLKSPIGHDENVPPPFIYEGYWANYADIEATFPEDWNCFDAREKNLFNNLWKSRAYSIVRTAAWLLRQQVRILFVPKIKPLVRLLYIPIQFIFPVILLLAIIRSPRIITRVLADVRLYARPKGMSEHAIIQRIEFRVGSAFLKLIGLDWDFQPLPANQRVAASGSPFDCTRVIWASHSLGSVISYNVLSDLFHRAEQLEKTGTPIQKKGVRRFQKSLRRFVTFGSPLDKFAVLFPEAMRPWPEHTKSRLLDTNGDTYIFEGKKKTQTAQRSWWINFYHRLDPVSGALNHPSLCKTIAPINIESEWTSLALIPGIAHSSYWSSLSMLRFLLGRTYGKEYLKDEDIHFRSFHNRVWTAILGYVIWVILLYGILFFLLWFHADIFQWIVTFLF